MKKLFALTVLIALLAPVNVEASGSLSTLWTNCTCRYHCETMPFQTTNPTSPEACLNQAKVDYCNAVITISYMCNNLFNGPLSGNSDEFNAAILNLSEHCDDAEAEYNKDIRLCPGS